MTLKTLSRITSILSQLETFKVRELAITTLILSSVNIFGLGMLPVGQLPMAITTMSQFTAILFQLDTNEVRQLAVTE